MNNQTRKSTCIYNFFFGITTFCSIVSSSNLVNAEISPDNTLPNNSEVKVEGNKSTIEGGTRNEGNLFHSFEKFGVTTGGEAHFNNAVDISNIITRVTGNSISDIDGLIKANGSANLFLINPNGIVFGENARLDIGGSFLGSTADSLIFPGDVEFSAVNPQSKPLLTMNVPMGLQYGRNPGSIQVKGASEVIDTQAGLLVKPDKTLALIGGDINLEAATLKTGGGRIELGSVAAVGLVNIAPVEKGFSFNYDNLDGGNIKLSQQTLVDASGNGAGDIQVWGRNIKITDGSIIGIMTGVSEDGGSLLVNATESVQMIGNSDSQFTGLFTGVSSQATGKGADITIKTDNLLVKDGANVGSRTFGEGNGGNLNIDAQDVQLIGDSTSLFAFAEENLTGNAGDITIKTNNLLVKDEATINASTFGEGRGGNLSIDAQDVQLTNKSNLFAVSGGNSTRDSGDLTITTNSFLAKDGVIIGTRTSG
ncbi:MAG: filamentous hemagglutinin N-terminal domain-containing protein, partial [Rivularia sp. (in: Bacteria)]|nr:filamentous hemagglutinin N-terminal domain-containing protein [Rivularia sp. MS3]